MDEPAAPKKNLWHSPEFLKFWAGQTISELGSHITRDGLPLLAVITLGASASQMGLLNAVGSVPVIMFSLFAGVWVDRMRRRPLMITADIGRALLLGSIPLAAITGWLSMTQLFIVVPLAGILSIFFETAYHAYLPGLVERDNLVEGNSKLALSGSITEILGPGLTGMLVQTITAPLAIFFDAVSFIFSAISLASMHKPEQPTPPVEQRQAVFQEAREGLKAVFHNPVLRALALAATTTSFFGSFIGVLYALYAIRILKITPAALGFSIAVGGVSSLLGSLLAVPMAKALGLGRTLVIALWISALFTLLIPLAGSFPTLSLLLLILAQFGDMMGTIYFINSMSLRQSITPDRLLGRVNASISLLAGGIGPLGALVGGLLGDRLGIQTTLIIAGGGLMLSGLWLLIGPILILSEL